MKIPLPSYKFIVILGQLLQDMLISFSKSIKEVCKV
jgi:hypothetical protein